MTMTKQEALDQRLTNACDDLDFNGVIKAIADGANANCYCDSTAWWFYCCINRTLDSAYHSDNADAFDTAYKIIECLLQNGANPNQIIHGDNGQSVFTPLYDAFDLCPDTKIPRLLLKYGADVNLPHDDAQFTLYDMQVQDWCYTPQDHNQKNNETQEQAVLRNGLLYFDKRELLLEHAALSYDLQHPAYLWEKLTDEESEFLDACGRMDTINLKRLLKMKAALIDTKDNKDNQYGVYIIRWGSHNCRCETIGHRELFERRCIDVLEYLISQDSKPYDKLLGAAWETIEFGYPNILEWLLPQLTLCDKERLAKDSKSFSEQYLNFAGIYLPEAICVKMEALLGADPSQKNIHGFLLD